MAALPASGVFFLNCVAAHLHVGVGNKPGTHACYAIWMGSILSRSGVRVIKASVTRDQPSGGS